MKNPRAVSAVTQKIAEQVYEHASAGRMVLTLGGDHSIAIGTIAGTARAIRERHGRDLAVIWVDAHADLNTPETSESGNIHGMPVSFLTGLSMEDRSDIFGWLQEEPHNLATSSVPGGTMPSGNANTGPAVRTPTSGIISTKKLVYIGLRDVDRGEKEILRKEGIKAFSMHDIDR